MYNNRTYVGLRLVVPFTPIVLIELILILRFLVFPEFYQNFDSDSFISTWF